MYINGHAFLAEGVDTVAFSSKCFYVYHQGVGRSSAEGAAEKLFSEYEVCKGELLPFAIKKGVGKIPIYRSHRESLRFMQVLTNDYILKGESKSETIARIERYFSYNFVKQAKEFFREWQKTQELDEEMAYFANEDSPETYYQYCIGKLDCLALRRAKYYLGQLMKVIVRFISVRG